MGEAAMIAQAVSATAQAAEGIAKTKTGEILAETTKDVFSEAAHTTGDVIRQVTPEGISGVKTLYHDREDARKFAATTPEEFARGIGRAPVALAEELGKLPTVMIKNTKGAISAIFNSDEPEKPSTAKAGPVMAQGEDSARGPGGKDGGCYCGAGNFDDFVEDHSIFGGLPEILTNNLFVAYCILAVLFMIAIYIMTDEPENVKKNLVFGGLGAIIVGAMIFMPVQPGFTGAIV